MLQGQGLLPEEIWPMMGCLLVPGWSKDLFYYYQAIGPLHRLNEVQEIQIQQSMSDPSFQFMHLGL